MSTEAFRFILSAEAGSGLPLDLPKRIEAAFAGLNKPDIRITDHSGHVAELAREWAEEYGERGVVYACGGDGTLHESADALRGTECAFGALPFGTGNDFAKTLYGSRQPEREVELLIRNSPRPQFRHIDMLAVNDSSCLNVLSLGFDTLVLEKAIALLKKRPSLGKQAYVAAVLSCLGEKKEFALRYELTREDGQVERGEKTAILLAAGNGQFYGSGYRPLPDARTDDGLGDFLLAEKMSFGRMLSLILKYRQGTHVGAEGVTYRRFRKLLIESTDGSEIPANADGIVFRAGRIELEVLPSVLRLAYPG